ncbi:hypothetical protein BX600DRAFT_509621 [Xylariales sp. PMI_506]|nr:hypothetical protein BX600DRAFT_509621 [Xylariales sp. PMI_506]
MAFHQTTRQATQRVFRPAVEDDANAAPLPAAHSINESQTWVLFSPATDAGTTTSYLTETHHTKSTPGRSRLSDLGSLHTVARSEESGDQERTASLCTADDEDEREIGEEEDDAELDSLDSHLPEFRSTPNFLNSAQGLAPIVPVHDGLGSFRLDREGMGTDAQDRLYAFEQFNPRRVKRRRESLELAQVELERQEEHEVDKMGRIEAWRLEQSRYLLEEIQRETRRRRRSTASLAPVEPATTKAAGITVRDDPQDPVSDLVDDDDAWHEQHASDMGEGESESFWGRITRKVIRDIIGIDDKLLSVLFGESLPAEDDDLSTTPKASSILREASNEHPVDDSLEPSSWQLKILERIAKELGLFIHQISEHPGAFSTFTRMQQMPIPYAGLPAIPESAIDTTVSREPSTAIPEFKPTIGLQARPIDVPTSRAIPGAPATTSHPPGETSGNSAVFTREEWEQDLDVRLVFRYLRSRFLSRSNSTGSASGNANHATSSAQDVAAKAARVRQHHPLVSRARPSERRSFKATTPASPVLFRHTSSCASQSTRRRRSSCSSRHYWDIGAGSVGTGSIIAAAGPMGSWGEV